MERKELLVVVLIAVLLVTTAIQTASLIGMGGGSVTVSKSVSPASSPSQQSAGSSPAQKAGAANLNDLPGMVGGC